ncbi:MAG: Mut7-C RNAse domain-containing protein [Methanomicrobiaceae archaeon]|nr:Mut7-C RNAse domain-containing protein [Methanomicrobiaceae archaeon]
MSEPRFVADRMVGTLARFLRFLGYDVRSAHALREGNRREDTDLLRIAGEEGRILLTRDRELARRGGERAVLIKSSEVTEQLCQLVRSGVIDPSLQIRMDRCSLCNTLLRPATEEEVSCTDYAPEGRSDLEYYWCLRCGKLYWMGSHGENLAERFERVRARCSPDQPRS